MVVGNPEEKETHGNASLQMKEGKGAGLGGCFLACLEGWGGYKMLKARSL